MQHIVVGTNGTQRAEQAVEWAARRALSDGARLHVVGSYGEPQEYTPRIEYTLAPSDVRHLLRPSGPVETLLAETRAPLVARGIDVQTWLGDAPPARLLCTVVRNTGAGLLVVGDGRTVPRKLQRRSPCAVQVVGRCELPGQLLTGRLWRSAPRGARVSHG